jgi:hypothetical protein
VIDTSVLLSSIERAQRQLLLAAEDLCEGDDHVDVDSVRAEVRNALGALVTARRELGSVEAEAQQHGLVLQPSDVIKPNGSRKPRRHARRS